jgi:opacity protein-like surface antigen
MNKRLLSAVLVILTLNIYGQNNTSSTYSGYGIGLLNNKADVTNAGMGYAGMALPSKGLLNNLNAASYSAIDSVKFLFNLQGSLSFSTFETNSDQQKNTDSNIESFSFGFRAGKNWGMGFSLSPYSSIGYNVNSEKYILGTQDKYPVNYYGEGGISQLSWHNGFQVTKGLSLGLSASYLWGSTDMIEVSYYPSLIGETIYNERNYHVSSFLLEYSFQYHQPIGMSTLSFAGSVNMSTELNTYYKQRIYNNVTSDLSSKSEDVDNMFIPLSYKAGVALQTSKGWTIAADYRYGDWSQAELSISGGELRDTHGGSFGIQYAAPRHHRSIFRRMQYRVGAFYDQEYINIKGKDIDVMGFTAGLTIPMRDGSKINLAYEYKERGTTDAGLIQEQYNTIKLGITFNETWFQKRKFK